ncbi:helix-turn-helix transcriptional regulator [Jeongeupia sp. USM3]|uniref:helix-turn-helix domain-containing protein n=1 Tax=Jeongeupia sp. USM3 TaxID=1906741 RepID=UPI0009F31A58|nr:helix-turn-helix transcriptional regulator [Jeongeupia sp. USM3]
MSPTTTSPAACWPTTAIWFNTPISTATATGSRPIHVVHVAPKATQSADIDDFISQLCTEDPRLDAAISEGTKWVGETFYADQPDSIKKRRMAAGLTQAQLAKRMDTSQSYVAKLENSDIEPGFDVIRRLSAALSLQPEQAFSLLYANNEMKRHG